MGVEINYWAVLLAGLSAMIVGSIWYVPQVFGNAWMKLTGIKPNKNLQRSEMILLYVVAFLTALVTAYVLAHFIFLAHFFFNNSMLQDALTTGFWAWLGFTATRHLVHDSFEGRSLQLTIMNAGNGLVTILVMAFVIGVMG